MASIRKRQSKWHAQVRRSGQSRTRTFTHKADAEAWARKIEREIDTGELKAISNALNSMTVGDLLLRYRDEVMVNKRGAHVEVYIVDRFLRHPVSCSILARFSSRQISQYRDERLKTVKGGTVHRELAVLRHCFEVARKDWGVPLKVNPVAEVTMPALGRPRERRVTEAELLALKTACSHPLLWPIITIAIETGMRRGEVVNMHWSDIDWNLGTLHIPTTKNGHPRTIPLTQMAIDTRGGGNQVASQLRHRLADIWHLIAILYVIAIFGVWALEVPGGFDFVLRSTVFSIAVIAVAYGLSLLAKQGLRKVFSISDEQKARLPGLEARANRYLPILIATARGLFFVAALLAVLTIWGIDAVGWIATPTGAIIAKSIVNIVVIIVVALLVWELISFFIERYLVTGGKDGSPTTGGQRALTLLPLLRTAVLITLAILVTLTVLSELGVDIAPLIAGAGIIGLAVGFGAQTFVKDVITGLFILIEDSVAVGDLVVLGGYRGKVESMSLRSIQLRDLQGDVHRIPFSEVTSTTNRSKVFSFAFFDIGIAYREDVDHCMNVIREVGAEMRQDENFASMITEDIEIMGVQSFDDSAVIIRARFKVLPGKQLGVQRAFNRLLKNRFDAECIEIPFPHRTIYFGVDGQGNAPSAHVQLHEPKMGRDKRPKAILSQAPEGERADFD